jgi:hypothetical protein
LRCLKTLVRRPLAASAAAGAASAAARAQNRTLLLQMHASGPALTNMDWLSFFASMISTSTMQEHRLRYSKS